MHKYIARLLHEAPWRNETADSGESSVLYSNRQRSRVVPTIAFDCIRGFAAIQVYCGHYFSFFAKQHDRNAIHRYGQSLNQADFGGGNAVFMFFIMSGFLMQIGYSSKLPRLAKTNIFNSVVFEKAVHWWDFMKQRVARVTPLVWLSILINIPFTIQGEKYGGGPSGLYVAYNDDYYGGGVSHSKTASGYLLYLFFLNDWPVTTMAVNPPLWTIFSQFFCYAFFPFIVGPFHTVRNTSRLVGEVTLAYAIYLVVFLYQFYWTNNPYVMDNYSDTHLNPVNKLPLFIMGCFFGSQTLTNLSVVKSEKYILYWSVVCNGLTMFMTLYCFLEVILGFTVDGASYLMRIMGELFLPPLYGLWLYSFTQSPTCLAYRIFSWKPFKLLGTVSFAFYCLHWPLLTYYCWIRFGIKYWVLSTDATRLNDWEVVPVGIMILVISVLAYYFIEAPGRKFLQKWIGKLLNVIVSALSVSESQYSSVPHNVVVPMPMQLTSLLKEDNKKKTLPHGQLIRDNFNLDEEDLPVAHALNITSSGSPMTINHWR